MTIASETFSNVQLHSVRDGLAVIEVDSKVFKVQFSNSMPVDVQIKGEDTSNLNANLKAFSDIYEALSYIIKRGSKGHQ